MIEKNTNSTHQNQIVAFEGLAKLRAASLDSYISSTYRIPMLTQDEEQNLAYNYRVHNDLRAAEKMVLSHLRLVVSTARNHLGPGMNHADLIQEGNIGLMKAVKGFDERKGVRLGTYALPWIRSEMLQYVINNTRMARIATSKPQRKLFFGLNKFRTNNKPLSYKQIVEVSEELKVPVSDVLEMDMRLSCNDVSMDVSAFDDEASGGAEDYLGSEEYEPIEVIDKKRTYSLHSEGLESALSTLDARSRRIVETRWLCDSDSQALTLSDLAEEFGVSAERIRQIEVAAMKKMRNTLTAYM